MLAPTSAAKLLDTWEQGRGQNLALRALFLLQWFHPGVERATLAHLTIGARNAELLALRQQLFGPELAALATCPSCGETLELSFRMADILTQPPAQFEAQERIWVEAMHKGRPVRFRPPDSADLLAVGEVTDAPALRWLLLARCVDAPVDEMPAALLAEIMDRMDEADPQADVRLNLTCPTCTHTWQAPFDIVAFLWREVDDWAERTLREVHLLASAYGWSEGEILSLSAQRRQLYLEMIGG